MNLKPPNVSNWLFDNKVPRQLTYNNTLPNDFISDEKTQQQRISLVKQPHILSYQNLDRNIQVTNRNPNPNPNPNPNSLSNNQNLPVKSVITNRVLNHRNITQVFGKLTSSQQGEIVGILLEEFPTNLDIHATTKIHQLYDQSGLIGLACSEYDEIVANLFRKKGCKEVEGLGLRSDGIYLYNLWIKPSLRHQGIGRGFINYVEDYYRGVGKKSIRVQVQQNNSNSLQLFNKLGYLVENTLLDPNGKVQLNLSKWL